jgi:hypothetical protein
LIWVRGVRGAEAGAQVGQGIDHFEEFRFRVIRVHDVPDFVFDPSKALKHQLADVGKDGSAARRNAISGNENEEAAEDMIDRGSGLEALDGTKELGREVRTCWLESQRYMRLFPLGVAGAERAVALGAWHGAAATGGVRVLTAGDAGSRSGASRGTGVGIGFGHR